MVMSLWSRFLAQAVYIKTLGLRLRHFTANATIGLFEHTKPFISRRSRVCTYVSVCLSVCHKPEMRENGSTDRVSFGTEILSSCIRRIFVYPKKGTSFWNCVVSKEITKKVKVAHTRLPSVGFRS